ncbi:unnamed protein product [Paramecium pentaurelia]|uniref:Myb-like DNA-binding domain protein n=1 Tax=Paramecium pentaurelia TaxID=43138 RepID=A0A8S1WYK0_9CILI|nr:unnamed protein product [Paramecium pentaurelia]
MQIEFDQYLSLLKNLDQEKDKKIRNLYSQLEINQSEISKWNESQSKLLKSLIQIYCTNQNITYIHVPDNVWNIVSKLLNKSVMDCKQQLENSKKFIFHQQSWTKSEDEVLKEICNQYLSENKPFKWNEIAKELSQKCNKSTIKLTKYVRDRWINQLNPQIQKGPWGAIEEFKLMKTILKHGKNWQMIASEMKNHRTESSIKNRYFKILKKLELKEVQLLNKQQIENELQTFNLSQFFGIQQLGQQEISLILFYLNELNQKLQKSQNNQYIDQEENDQQKLEIQVDINNTQKRKLKPSQKSNNSHATNILQKVLEQYQQDQCLDYNKIKDHFQDIVAQKGETLELDEEPLSNSDNLSEVQFAIINKDSQNLQVFPKTQLKAVMEVIKQKKEIKKDSKKEQKRIKQQVHLDGQHMVNQKQQQFNHHQQRMLRINKQIHTKI